MIPMEPGVVFGEWRGLGVEGHGCERDNTPEMGDRGRGWKDLNGGIRAMTSTLHLKIESEYWERRSTFCRNCRAMNEGGGPFLGMG